MQLKPIIKDTPVWMYIASLSIIVGASVYQSVVILPEFTRDLPTSLLNLANSPIKPTNFWGNPILPIVGMLLPILSLITNWNTPRRKWLVFAFGFGIAASAFTVTYFYPGLEIMGFFGKPATADMDLLIKTTKDWVYWDNYRFWVCLVPAYLLVLKALSIPSAKAGTYVVKEKKQKAAVAIH